MSLLPSNARRRSVPLGAAALLAALALVGCGGSSDGAAAAPRITGAWARTSPTSATVGAVYATIEVDTDDRLVAVSVDASVAGSAEIHEMVPVSGSDSDMGDDDMADDMGHDDMDDDMDHDDMGDDMDHEDMEDDMSEMPMQMQEVDGGLAVTAGEPTVLEPGGYHVMLIDLAAPLEVGSTVPVTFTFESAGDMTIDVEVRDSAP